MEEFKIALGVEMEQSELDSINSLIKNAKIEPIKLQLDKKQVQNQIDSIRTQIENLSNIKINLTGINSGQGAKQFVNDLGQAEERTKRLKDALYEKIEVGIKVKDYDNEFSKVENKFNRMKISNESLNVSVKDLENKLKLLKTAFVENNNIDSVISAYKEYEEALKRVNNEIDINNRENKEGLDAQKLTTARQALSSKMDVWLKNNSAAAKEFGHKIDYLKAKLKDCNEVELAGILSEFQDLIRQAQLAGKATMSFGDRLKVQLSKLSTYFSANAIISKAIEALRKMYDNVVEVDTAMTGLYRVTNLTSEQYEDLYDKMIASAKEYGATLSDLITSTADWARLGFDASTAAQLSEITTMYQHVTDIDNGTAVENLVTAYKGFQEQLLNMHGGDEAQAIEYIADIFDKLGNEFAVSAEDVGAALTKCSSTLAQAGNTIQQASAMATGIAEVTQDPEKAGSALKILSLRLRGMKGQLQELGEEVDENVESISKMQTQVLNLTHGKVNIFNDDGTFKSTYEIMDGIAEIYNELSDTDRADLLETIAGKNRANDVSALLSNWNQVESAMKAAINAEGTAAEENKRYMESIEGKSAALTAAWQSFSNTFLDSETLKSGIEFLTGLLEVLEKIFKVLDSGESIFGGMAGIITPLVGGVAAYSSIKDNAGELINQFQFLIMLRIEYARKPFTNGNMNETVCKLVA